MEDKFSNLRILINKIAQEKGYENESVDIQDISSEGANYSSTLHVATVSEPGKEKLNLFAKVASISDELRASSGNFVKCYDIERVFYTKLAVAFDRLYEKHGVKIENRLNVPTYYGHESTNSRETVVLENLAASGFESFDRFKPFDWDYASAAVSQLAKFHALGIAAKEENLKELDHIREIGFDPFACGDMRSVLINQALKLGRENLKEEYGPRLQKYLTEENMTNDWAVLWKNSDAGFLVHSDYKPVNLMHRKRNGKVDIVPLDYQTLHFGVLAADLLYFIWCGSDSKFRQKHYLQLLELYYTELATALQNLHIDIDKAYPRKTYEKELEDCKTLGLMIALNLVPVQMVKPEDAPQMDGSEIQVVLPNQLALEKINGIVEDYIKWGII